MNDIFNENGVRVVPSIYTDSGTTPVDEDYPRGFFVVYTPDKRGFPAYTRYFPAKEVAIQFAEDRAKEL